MYGPFELKRREPDWAGLGFTICGSTASRPGDDGDFLMGTSVREVRRAQERELQLTRPPGR